MTWKLVNPIDVLEDEQDCFYTEGSDITLRIIGLLHSVQSLAQLVENWSQTCNFIHLAVQDLLAAYYNISRLESAEHYKQFETLIS